MATIFTVTLTNSTADFGATQKSERCEIVYLLEMISQQVGSGAVNSGTSRDRNKGSAGTWTYTPVASA